MINEAVYTKDLLTLIRKEYPEESWSSLSRRLGRCDDYLGGKRKTTKTQLRTADEILTGLDMSHVLYTGELDVVTYQVKETGGQLGRAERSRNFWKKRALQRSREAKQLKDRIKYQNTKIEKLIGLVEGYEIELGIRKLPEA